MENSPITKQELSEVLSAFEVSFFKNLEKVLGVFPSDDDDGVIPEEWKHRRTNLISGISNEMNEVLRYTICGFDEIDPTQSFLPHRHSLPERIQSVISEWDRAITGKNLMQDLLALVIINVCGFAVILAGWTFIVFKFLL